MLPHVAAEDRLGAVHERVFAVGGLHNGDPAVLDRKPCPAGSELTDAGLDKILFHLSDRAEILDDLLLESARQGAAAVRLHPLPEMEVVVMLASIVEERLVLAIGAGDD